MYQKTITPNANAVITPSQLAVFGRFELPQQYVTGSSPAVLTDDYEALLEYIAAATEQVEIMAQTALQLEQALLTLDYFPNTQDPRNELQYELAYSFAITPWWWWGFPTKDSIELVRRPVQVPTLGSSFAVTSVSVANNFVTVGSDTTLPSWVVVGAVIVPTGTAEGSLTDPQSTPSTTPFLNGAPLTVLTVNGSSFTAAFNFGTQSGTVFTPGSYTNNSDTGIATLVTNPVLIQYYDENGNLQTWNTSNYFVLDNKIGLTVGSWWPNTDRRQDCIQITYWAGNATSPAANGLPANSINPRLKQAVKYLANHMRENPSFVAVEPTSEVYGTLCMMLSAFKTYRIPR